MLFYKIGRCFSVFVLSTFLCFFSTTPYAVKPFDATKTLLATTLAPTPIMDDLQELTNNVGGRPTGSVAMTKAEQWGLKHFREAGLENVHSEAYRPRMNWLPGVEHGEWTISGQSSRKALRIASMPFSKNTPKDGLEAEVYDIGRGDKKAFMEAGSATRGKWLLITTPLTRSLNDLTNEYAMKFSIVARAKKSGAVGLLWVSSRPGRLLYRHDLTFNDRMGSTPAAVIERRVGKHMAQLMKKGHVIKARLTIDNVIQKNPVNHNVIAEVKGWEKPDEVVLLGAHLDSWDLGKGALDNGCNTALVIDSARQIMRLANAGHRPRRTLRFVLYSGEEIGLLGSWFDAKNHRDELDNLKAVLIYDLGSGKTTGFSLGGRYDMKDLVKNALASLSGQFGPFTQTFDAAIDTDNFDYLLEGVPTLMANQDPLPYLESYHAESDTLDKVDLKELKKNTAIASVFLWNLANTNATYAPRQHSDAILALLKSTGLEKEMKHIKIWNDFVSGQRGRINS